MITVKCKVSLKLANRKPKTPEPAVDPVVMRRGKVPRISRLVALGIRYEEMLCRGEVKDTTELAEMGRVTQPRITQILSLALLAPNIQEELLFLPRELRGKTAVTEKLLRPITGELDWERQRELWRALLTRLNNLTADAEFAVLPRFSAE